MLFRSVASTRAIFAVRTQTGSTPGKSTIVAEASPREKNSQRRPSTGAAIHARWGCSGESLWWNTSNLVERSKLRAAETDTNPKCKRGRHSHPRLRFGLVYCGLKCVRFGRAEYNSTHRRCCHSPIWASTFSTAFSGSSASASNRYETRGESLGVYEQMKMN